MSEGKLASDAVSVTKIGYSAGGGRFLKVQRDQDVGPDRLHVILNFVAELTASSPLGR